KAGLRVFPVAGVRTWALPIWKSRRRPAAPRGAFAVAASAVTMTLVAQPASAAERDGKCDKGEFCYYYNSNNKGSISDHTKSVPDLGAKQPSCYEFKGAGNEIGRAHV